VSGYYLELPLLIHCFVQLDMAVTGVPKPDPNHAVVMTKFARDCILHFNMVTERLRSTLGEDTKDLALRVGLNSGPVTAGEFMDLTCIAPGHVTTPLSAQFDFLVTGVLRGQKARFQLFGDVSSLFGYVT
jgi:hypothetical protein